MTSLAPTRAFVLAALVLAGCGADKSTTSEAATADSTTPGTTAPTTDNTGATSLLTTTPTTGTTDTTTGKIPCDQPEPDDCLCAPGNGMNVCVDGSWQCQCDDPPTSSPDTDEDDGDSTASEPTATGGADIDCNADPQVFPPFHKPACMVTADCTVGLHQVDCCGTREAWGIAVADEPAFNAAEITCNQQFPICDCMPGATLADDGKAGDTPQDFAAACLNNVCLSFVP